MNRGGASVAILYEDREELLKSAEKIESLGECMIYFGHGKPVRNKKWVKERD